MPNTFDVDRARKETRACGDIVHFNNAGSSLMPVPVSETLHQYLRREEFEGGYETADRENEALENFYKAASKLLNCSEDEIAYVENATRAWDMAFYSFRFGPGDKIITTISEYGSNVVAYIQQARRFGVEIVFAPNDDSGQIDTMALADLIDDRVKLISINHIPTGCGLVNPAAEVGRIAIAHGIPFLLDACQSIGQIPLDVNEIRCDVLSGTGRKFLRGPRGTGLLYVRREWIEKLEPPILDQHAAELVSPTAYDIQTDARRFENWEQYFAGKAALGAAIDYALSWGIQAIQSRVYALAERLRGKLTEIDGVTVTDEGAEKCGIVTFIHREMKAGEVKAALAEKKINVSVSSGSPTLVPFLHRGLTAVARASLHYYNTDDEIDYFIETLREVLGRGL